MTEATESFLMNFLLPLLIGVALIMEQSKNKRIKNGFMFFGLGCVFLLGAINWQRDKATTARENHNDSVIEHLKIQVDSCNGFGKKNKEGIDSILKNPTKVTNKQTNITNINNEPELSKAELMSAFDSIVKYSPKSKCYSFYIADGINVGKIKSQLEKLLKSKGYKYTGGGPLTWQTPTPLSFIDESGCVGIVLDNFQPKYE